MCVFLRYTIQFISVVFYKRVDLDTGNHTCKAEVGYMNCLPLIAGCPPITANITITCMLTKKTCYP